MSYILQNAYTLLYRNIGIASLGFLSSPQQYLRSMSKKGGVSILSVSVPGSAQTD